MCCDLLSKLYLWLTSYIQRISTSWRARVVICFQNCIFDLLHTSNRFRFYHVNGLWFAFKIVSLTYFIHLIGASIEASACCDLLSKLYLWLTSYIFLWIDFHFRIVVICFQNCIFDLLHTSILNLSKEVAPLWFAFKIVSLTYFIHLDKWF